MEYEEPFSKWSVMDGTVTFKSSMMDWFVWTIEGKMEGEIADAWIVIGLRGVTEFIGDTHANRYSKTSKLKDVLHEICKRSQ